MNHYQSIKSHLSIISVHKMFQGNQRPGLHVALDLMTFSQALRGSQFSCCKAKGWGTTGGMAMASQKNRQTWHEWPTLHDLLRSTAWWSLQPQAICSTPLRMTRALRRLLDDRGKFSLGRCQGWSPPSHQECKGALFHACHRRRVLAYVVGHAKKETQTLVLPLEH